MATINLNQVNEYIKNYYDQIQLSDLDQIHSQEVQEWFKENLSAIGRYGHRDFERFGMLKSNSGRIGRQDGWVSLTEEVPNEEHLTYGTGALYIHGEMEIPKVGDKIEGDEFGKIEHIYEDTVKPKHFVASGSERGISYGDQGENGSANPRQPGGFVWRIEEESRPSGDKNNRWMYESITDAAGGDRIEEKTATPSGDKNTPTNFNDQEVYHLDNERNNFPFVIIRSAQPQSIKNFLDSWQGDKGMYDEELPALAQNAYPPSTGIKVTDADAIVAYISPLEDK